VDTRLIVTADDYGLSPEVNRAVEHAAREGILTGASLMVGGDGFREAVRMAKNLPSLQVGLHLSLTEGRSVLGGSRLTTGPTLIGLALQFNRSVRNRIEREVKGQFLLFSKTGLPFEHIDSHHHLHLHPKLLNMVLENAARYHLTSLRVPYEPWEISGSILRGHRVRNRFYREVLAPLSVRCKEKARSAGMLSADGVFGLYQTGEWTEERLLVLMDRLVGWPGTFEVYTHPSDGGESAGIRELEALVSKKVREKIHRGKIRLVQYRDLATPTAPEQAPRGGPLLRPP
jgi:chitin disaccharide deacetylase